MLKEIVSRVSLSLYWLCPRSQIKYVLLSTCSVYTRTLNILYMSEVHYNKLRRKQ